MSKHLEQETYINICNDYNINKLSANDISIKYNLLISRVYKILQRYNIDKHVHFDTTELSDHILLESIELYKSGISIIKICDKLNLPYDRLRFKYKKLGIDIRDNFSYSRKYYCNNDFFESIDTEEKAYWLGFIVADGNITQNNKKVRIKLHKQDEDHLNKFAKSIDATYKAKDIKNGKIIQTYIQITSEKMVQDLAKYGVIPAKTDKVFYPDIPEKLDRHFIRGYFDGDGWISKNNSGFQFGLCGNYNLLKSIQSSIVNKLNFNDTNIREKPGVFEFTYGGNNQFVKIMNWLYNDSFIYLDRKYIKYINSLNIINGEQK